MRSSRCARVPYQRLRRGLIGPRCARWCAFALLSVCLIRATAAQAEGPGSAPERLRLIFSSRMFTDVHESDAKAAVKAWAEALARERHIQAEPDAQVIDGLSALAIAWKAGQPDLMTLTAEEYLELGVNPEHANVVTGVAGGEYLVEYLLLVHQGAGIHDLAGLQGLTVLIYENSRTCLALPWLDTILLQGGLAPANEHFARVTQVKKLSSVVLPVFFRQADACVVTLSGLRTLSEMNPQVGSQLQVIATSPALLPSLSYLPARSAGSTVDLLGEILRLHTTASGRQLLNLFQVDRLIEIPASEIDGARELLATQRRLTKQLEASRQTGATKGLHGTTRAGAAANVFGRGE